jgi:hypothetical protein
MMSKQGKSKAAKAESPKPATPQAVPAPQAGVSSFGGIVLEVTVPSSKMTAAQDDKATPKDTPMSIPDATKPLPPIFCDVQGSVSYPLVGKATRQQHEARSLAVKRAMAIPGGRHSFAPGGIQWDHAKWEQETGQTFPLSMQEAAALAEKIGYMLAIDFVNAGYAMDAAIMALRNFLVRKREAEREDRMTAAPAPAETKNLTFNAPVIIQQNEKGNNTVIGQEHQPSKATAARSAWSGGLFYLVALVVIVGILGLLTFLLAAFNLLSMLSTIFVESILALLVVGVLVLRHYNRISEKGFLKVIHMVLPWLPDKLTEKKDEQA